MPNDRKLRSDVQLHLTGPPDHATMDATPGMMRVTFRRNWQEESGAGKPHARICEGEAEWPSYSTMIVVGEPACAEPDIERRSNRRACRPVAKGWRDRAV